VSADPGFAPAKVNLTLHVTGRRADGYHLLDSVVAFADVGDRLTVAPGDGLTVTGPFAPGVPTDDANLVRRALRLAGAPRAVTLEKHLPHPGGIGGGSSDAAAALRLVGAAPPVAALLGLGADLPVCMAARAARMRGVGERVAPLALPPLPAVLLHPGLDCPTGAVFRALASPDNPGHDAVPEGLDAAAFAAWLARQRNDLEPAAQAVAPGIGAALDVLRASGAAVARMSGSGATCFGLYATPGAAEAAARGLARPGWWVRATVLR
jgi:4-diphosphocytidyl-2-C-methyl-D-erythritol kinase